MSRKNELILNQLSSALMKNDDFLSALSLSKMLNVSETVIRKKVDEMNEMLVQAHLGSIEKKPRKGIRLIYDPQNAQKIADLFSNYEYIDITAGEELLYVYLRVLLSSNVERITVTRLSEMVYQSVPVCSRHLETCTQWLSLFNIQLSIKRNYGISLQGSEENKRLAIKHLVINDPIHSVEQSIQQFAKGINLELLKSCIADIEKEWNFTFAEESYKSILLYAALAITRSDFSVLHLSESEEEIVVKYNEYNLAQSIFRIINKKFYVNIPESEVKYFAIQLLCSKMIHTQEIPAKEELTSYDKKLKQFVHKIISVISDIMNVALMDDNELYYGLLNHIRPAIFRMKFEKHSTKELTNFIQQEYKQTYRVSWALSALFEEYYDIKITSTELSYITLYIQTSLERRMRPLKIALVTELGMGLNQMFCNKIRMSIPKIDEIAIFSYHEVKIDVVGKYDLIVTTSKLDFDQEKVVQIKSLLSNTGVEELKQKIEIIRTQQLMDQRKFDPRCHNLFDPKLILIHPMVSDKEELLQRMNQVLNAGGYVTEHYIKSVLDREKTVSTYIGNGVAIPHGFQTYVNESKVVIAVLKEPLAWNSTDEVRLVFMLALRINNAYESKRTQAFYQGFLKLIDTDYDVEKLTEMDQNELYRYLMR